LSAVTDGVDIDSANLKALNRPANIIVIAGKKEFQKFPVLPEQQAQFQPGAALENVFSKPPDGNSAVRMRMAEAVGDHLKSGLDTGEIRFAQMLERGVKARA
jgi:hypothetical protein